jgi:hypothetical protein
MMAKGGLNAAASRVLESVKDNMTAKFMFLNEWEETEGRQGSIGAIPSYISVI